MHLKPTTAQKIRSKNIYISFLARELIEKADFSFEGEVEPVIVSVKDLGFIYGATLKEIYTAAQKQGYDLAPHSIIEWVIEQSFKINEHVFIAMEAITDSYGDLSVFYVGRSDVGAWLYASYGNPDYFWDGDYRFVFVRRKSSEPNTSLEKAIQICKENGLEVIKCY